MKAATVLLLLVLGLLRGSSAQMEHGADDDRTSITPSTTPDDNNHPVNDISKIPGENWFHWCSGRPSREIVVHAINTPPILYDETPEQNLYFNMTSLGRPFDRDDKFKLGLMKSLYYWYTTFAPCDLPANAWHCPQSTLNFNWFYWIGTSHTSGSRYFKIEIPGRDFCIIGIYELVWAPEGSG